MKRKNSEPSSLFFILIMLFAVLLSACEPAEQRQMFVFSGPMMGTDYRITVVTEMPLDQGALHERVLTEMNSVNQSMSTYLESSEVSVINRAAAGTTITVSEPLEEVLKKSYMVSDLSNGAFDITIGPLVGLWGFGVNGAIANLPSEEEIQEVAKSFGYQSLILQGNQLSKKYTGTQIDLSAIAKGYAVDLVARVLEKEGIDNYLVNIGGELRAAGTNIDQQVWQVGIEMPQMIGGIQKIVKLDNAAIATSGDYLNFLLIDGQHYSHTIDPSTLAPVLHRLALVSVIHEDAAMADALATAMMAMGEELAWDFAQTNQFAAYFTIRNELGSGIQSRFTPQFAKYFDHNH